MADRKTVKNWLAEMALWHEDKVVKDLSHSAFVMLEESRWIPVTERLPENYDMVICYTPVDGLMCVGFCHKYEWAGKMLLKWKIVTAMRGTQTLTKKVTHWMPLPEPPKEEEDAEVY